MICTCVASSKAIAIGATHRAGNNSEPDINLVNSRLRVPSEVPAASPLLDGNVRKRAGHRDPFAKD